MVIKSTAKKSSNAFSIIKYICFVHIIFFYLPLCNLIKNIRDSYYISISYMLATLSIEQVSLAFQVTYPRRKCCSIPPAFARSHPPWKHKVWNIRKIKQNPIRIITSHCRNNFEQMKHISKGNFRCPLLTSLSTRMIKICNKKSYRNN